MSPYSRIHPTPPAVRPTSGARAHLGPLGTRGLRWMLVLGSVVGSAVGSTACGTPHPAPAAEAQAAPPAPRATGTVLGLQPLNTRPQVHAEPVWRTGLATAPVQIVYYSDFECPYCRVQALTDDAAIVAVVAQHPTWALQFVDLIVPGHAHSLAASTAVRCALDPQGTQSPAFPALAQALFRRQSGWHLDTVPVATVVASVVPDDARQQYCRAAREATVATLLAANLAHARQQGANGTPSFTVHVGARDTILRGQTSAVELQGAISHLTATPSAVRP